MVLRIVEANEHTTEVVAGTLSGIRQADPPDVPVRDWLMIDGLWVAAALRGRGFGTQLLDAAEEIAIARGCRGAWLGTFDFQARAFYERRGYRVFAELPEFPPQHRHFHLAKNFA